MKFIEELKDGESHIEHYLCKEKQLLKSRAGKSYYSLKLQDKTGTIDGKVWELNNDVQNFEENDFIKIDFSVVSYQNDLQLNIRKLRKSRQGEYVEENYIPSTERDITEMRAELKEIIASISNIYLKKLLSNIFGNTETERSFAYHSAAKNMHHGYMGGLLEHTLSVIEICEFASKKYDMLNRDLLVTGAILHDIGKLHELSDFPQNNYTDDGQLLGHIYIGAEMAGIEAAKIEGFPPQLISLLKHLILSHHGEYEYGSPKRPKILEAFVLNFADNMDARIKSVDDIIEGATVSGDMWVGYQKMLTRNIRKTVF